MIIVYALREGVRHVLANRRLIIALWLLNFGMALSFALALHDQLRSSIGASLVHEKLRGGFDIDWYGEFEHQATGVGRSFSPAVIGVGPFITNLEAWLDGRLLEGYVGIVMLGLSYAAVWMFFLGGILDRFARPQGPLSAGRFLGAACRYFPRFLPLALLAGLLYYLVYKTVSPPMFAWAVEVTRDVIDERWVFLLTAGAYLAVVILLVLINVVSDYAKIAMVVNEQGNPLAAAWQGLRFVGAHPGRALGLYAVLGGVGLLSLGLYALMAPGAGPSNALTVTLAFLLGQAYLVLKLIVRLTFFSGQMALFQGHVRKDETALCPIALG